MGLFDIFDASGGQAAARSAHQVNTKRLNKGFDTYKDYGEQSIDTLQKGQGGALDALGAGAAYYQPLYERGSEGVDYYGQLVGLGGGDPAQMQQTLENIPGYQFSRDQGIDAINRTANSRGMLSSGNNTQDLMRFSQGLADQNYFSYLDALQPYFGMSQGAAQGMNNVASNMANVYTGTAGNIADVQSGIGRVGYDTQARIGGSAAQSIQDQYQAEQAANQNMWNAILGTAAGISSAAGQAGGFGNLFS